jgi:hypothetical protein
MFISSSREKKYSVVFIFCYNKKGVGKKERIIVVLFRKKVTTVHPERRTQRRVPEFYNERTLYEVCLCYPAVKFSDLKLKTFKN